ncbi:hypothetical protein BGAL_0204g00200 [Botrytis galanthina]|uniref:Uncharacterized protein n=1 Tax=Botrytis galanthina TaxID=278940 RepID=A0A4S8QZZ1_9HELO|nr:hypothetical protein BGAL_0204g00200 [Botrytis galanthina]
MDPVSAISLAAVIAQFIDYSCKIVCKSKEIYNSTSGLTTEHNRTEMVTLRLKELTQVIRPPPKKTNSGSSIVHSRLQMITQECIVVSDTLIDHLNQLKAPTQSQHPKWKSFRMALKSVWSKHEIDEFALRLRDLRKELDTELLLLLRDGSDSMSSAAESHFQKLDDNTKKVLNELLKMQSSDQDFLRRFERLSLSQQLEFQKLGLLTAKQNCSFEFLNKDTKHIIELLLESRVYCNENLILSRQLVEQKRQASTELVERDNRQRVRHAQKVRLAILESLRFSDMNHRPDMIASPYQNSFQWIFRDPTVHQKPWSNFATWLSESSGIYWIRGKPASGKSTLMRYIYEHPETAFLLKKWAGGSKIIMSAFYFWISGTERQRSHIGLLRTLLYGLLRQQQDLILEIFHDEWVRMCELETHDLEFKVDEWSLGRLQRALKRLVGMSGPSLKVCIFVDGIDEYEGAHGDMAEYLFDLAQEFPFTKFCISSRPLPDFLSVFQDACTLKLEDLSRDDIKNYVVAKFEQNQQMRKPTSNDLGTTSWLIGEIIQRAQGVFLWVILVVKSLIHGFRCGDGSIELRKRLESLPVDLENLFSHIIQKIEPEFRQDASKFFQIFRASGNNLDSITLHNALQFTSHHAIIAMEAAIESESMEKRLVKIAKTRLRLASRCRGLIEIADQHDGEMMTRSFTNDLLSMGEDIFDRYHTLYTKDLSWEQDSHYSEAQGRIFYIHSTAREFLEESRNWKDITKHTVDTTFDPELALLMARVIDIKLNPKDCVYKSGAEFLSQLRGFSWRNPKVMDEALELIHEADRVLSMRVDQGEVSGHWSQKDPIWAGKSRPDWGDDLDSAAVKFGLIPLLKARRSLTSAACYASQSQLPLPYISVKTRLGLPLLAYALRMDQWAVVDTAPDIFVLEELLINGADPNEHVSSFHTIWEYVIYMVHALVSKQNWRVSQHCSMWVKAFELMLKHGANPYACCVKRPDEFARLIGGSKAIPHLPRSKEEHDQRGFSFSRTTKRGYDDEVWDENDTYPYHHCVTAVVKDVFEPWNVPEHQDLQEIIRIQKEKKKRPRKRVERKARGGMASGIPDWTS